jgi:hypothetical protein
MVACATQRGRDVDVSPGTVCQHCSTMHEARHSSRSSFCQQTTLFLVKGSSFSSPILALRTSRLPSNFRSSKKSQLCVTQMLRYSPPCVRLSFPQSFAFLPRSLSSTNATLASRLRVPHHCVSRAQWTTVEEPISVVNKPGSEGRKRRENEAAIETASLPLLRLELRCYL